MASNPGQAADDEMAAARKIIDKLTASVTKDPAAARKEAVEIAKTLDTLEHIMYLYKKRDADGYGVGAKPGEIMPDGIEAKIQNMGRGKPMSAAQLEKEGPALIEMVQRTIAIGEITLAAAPKKKVGEKDPKDWKEYTEEMIKSSHELIKAIKAKDGKAVKAVVSQLNSSCNNCHGKFRD
jgi:hypothetical protein